MQNLFHYIADKSGHGVTHESTLIDAENMAVE